jgi:hypothetical protein
LHKALVIVPILSWVGVGALLHQTRGWPAAKLDEATVVVVPPRSATQPPGVAASPRATDRIGLARELQKELKRVGCYDGDVTGVWNAPARQAMRRFTDSVNAKLPLEEPDLVLLKLVQNHGDRVCSSPCSAAQSAGANGTCRPSAAGSDKPAPLGQPRSEEETQKSTPLIVSTAATATAAAAALSRSDPNALPAPAKPTNPLPQLSEDDPRQPRSGGRQSGPTPPASVYQSRRQPATRRADSRPPVVVKSLVRNVQRALGSLGIW